jgi:hypothetical protein
LDAFSSGSLAIFAAIRRATGAVPATVTRVTAHSLDYCFAVTAPSSRAAVQGLRASVNENSPLAEQYVNLIANALSVIDNGRYLAPTVQPNWDQSIKSDRLAKTNVIPGFESEDYKSIVSLLCSAHAANRNASQRLLRLYPSNNFYQSIQALPKQPKCDLGFVSESATYYFYNRIVEYDGTFPLDRQVKRGFKKIMTMAANG